MIEVIGGAPWVVQLRSNILDPLEMAVLTNPEETMLYRSAAGHVLDVDGSPALTPTPFLPRSIEAAGARLTMSPATLLRFAQMHLRDGVGTNGKRILSERSARAMRELQIEVPVRLAHLEGYGLAWAIRDASEGIVGHNGSTIGQSASLLLFPNADLAVSVLMNVTSATAGAAFEDILRAIAGSVPGMAVGEAPAVDSSIVIEPAPLIGRYRTAMSEIVVHTEGDDLRATVIHAHDDVIAPSPDDHYHLAPIDTHRFSAVDARSGGSSIVGFTNLADGVPRFLFWGGRLAERIAS